MNDEYIRLLDQARKEEKNLKKRLRLLGARQGLSKEVLRQAHQLHEETFSQIDCTDCANCCRELGPRISTADLDPLAKALGLKRQTFEKEWIRLDEDGDKVFAGLPCPFLDGNLCAVYTKRPRSCEDYPHTADRDIHKRLHRLGLDTQYCPAAYLIASKLLKHFQI